MHIVLVGKVTVYHLQIVCHLITTAYIKVCLVTFVLQNHF